MGPGFGFFVRVDLGQCQRGPGQPRRDFLSLGEGVQGGCGAIAEPLGAGQIDQNRIGIGLTSDQCIDSQGIAFLGLRPLGLQFIDNTQTVEPLPRVSRAILRAAAFPQ